MAYQKIGKDHCDWARLQACRKKGMWMCDAVTHNSPKGCMNPECFKYRFRTDDNWTIPQAFNAAGMPAGLGASVSKSLKRLGIGAVQIGKRRYTT